MGYISLWNTRLKCMSSSTYQENAEKSRVCEWMAHENAIFDDDTNIVTASGDQSTDKGMGCTAEEMYCNNDGAHRNSEICLFSSHKFRPHCFWFKRWTTCDLGLEVR